MSRFLELAALAWRLAAPHVVTVAACALVCWAAFLIWIPAGLVICALSLALIERKIEIDRR